MGFRTLRVINEDYVAPGRGFGAHRHEDMEIISIVLEGALAHRDSTGGEGVLRRGEVQRMSAGSGVVHSEFNGSETEPVHFFQIWIEPSAEGITPGCEQKLFPDEERRNRLRVLAAPGAPEGAVDIHQDARVYASLLDAGSSVDHEIATGRGAWIQLASGSIDVNGTTVNAGDGVAIEEETKLTISAKENAEFLLFDLG